MPQSIIRILVALGVATFGTTLPWVRVGDTNFAGQALAGDWMMIMALAGGGMLAYWDRSGRIVPERLLVARVCVGLGIVLMLNDLWDILRIDSAGLQWGWWISAAGMIAAMGLMTQLRSP